MDEWAAAEAAWEAACAALDNDGADDSTDGSTGPAGGGKRVRIVVALEPNAVRLGCSPFHRAPYGSGPG